MDEETKRSANLIVYRARLYRMQAGMPEHYNRSVRLIGMADGLMEALEIMGLLKKEAYR